MSLTNAKGLLGNPMGNGGAIHLGTGFGTGFLGGPGNPATLLAYVEIMLSNNISNQYDTVGRLFSAFNGAHTGFEIREGYSSNPTWKSGPDPDKHLYTPLGGTPTGDQPEAPADKVVVNKAPNALQTIKKGAPKEPAEGKAETAAVRVGGEEPLTKAGVAAGGRKVAVAPGTERVAKMGTTADGGPINLGNRNNPDGNGNINTKAFDKFMGVLDTTAQVGGAVLQIGSGLAFAYGTSGTGIGFFAGLAFAAKGLDNLQAIIRGDETGFKKALDLVVEDKTASRIDFWSNFADPNVIKAVVNGIRALPKLLSSFGKSKPPVTVPTKPPVVAPSTTSPANSPLLQRYLGETGGRWGTTATRQLNHQIATDLESQGFRVTGGAGRASEEWFAGPGGGTKGGTFVDITATNGKQTVRVQTVTTLADGVTLTTEEAAAAARIRARFPNNELRLISKTTRQVIP